MVFDLIPGMFSSGQFGVSCQFMRKQFLSNFLAFSRVNNFFCVSRFKIFCLYFKKTLTSVYCLIYVQCKNKFMARRVHFMSWPWFFGNSSNHPIWSHGLMLKLGSFGSAVLTRFRNRKNNTLYFRLFFLPGMLRMWWVRKSIKSKIL